MNIDDIANELKYLNERITIIDDNIKFNIMTFIGLLSLALVASGWALSVLSKKWVNQKVNKELEKSIKENPPIFYFKGKAELVWERDDKGIVHLCFYIAVDTKS